MTPQPHCPALHAFPCAQSPSERHGRLGAHRPITGLQYWCAPVHEPHELAAPDGSAGSTPQFRLKLCVTEKFMYFKDLSTLYMGMFWGVGVYREFGLPFFSTVVARQDSILIINVLSFSKFKTRRHWCAIYVFTLTC